MVFVPCEQYGVCMLERVERHRQLSVVGRDGRSGFHAHCDHVTC